LSRREKNLNGAENPHLKRLVKAGNFVAAARYQQQLGNYKEARDLYLQARLPTEAAAMALRLDEPGKAAALYERGKDYRQAARYYKEAGFEQRAIAMEERAPDERTNKPVTGLELSEDDGDSQPSAPAPSAKADAAEEDYLKTKAAADAGELTAQERLITAGSKAAEVMLAEGQIERAAETYRDSGHVEQAANLYINMLGLSGKAATLLAENGMHRRAAELYEEAGETRRALACWQKLSAEAADPLQHLREVERRFGLQAALKLLAAIAREHAPTEENIDLQHRIAKEYDRLDMPGEAISTRQAVDKLRPQQRDVEQRQDRQQSSPPPAPAPQAPAPQAPAPQAPAPQAPAPQAPAPWDRKGWGKGPAEEEEEVGFNVMDGLAAGKPSTPTPTAEWIDGSDADSKALLSQLEPTDWAPEPLRAVGARAPAPRNKKAGLGDIILVDEEDRNMVSGGTASGVGGDLAPPPVEIPDLLASGGTASGVGGDLEPPPVEIPDILASGRGHAEASPRAASPGETARAPAAALPEYFELPGPGERSSGKGAIGFDKDDLTPIHRASSAARRLGLEGAAAPPPFDPLTADSIEDLLDRAGEEPKSAAPSRSRSQMILVDPTGAEVAPPAGSGGPFQPTRLGLEEPFVTLRLARDNTVREAVSGGALEFLSDELEGQLPTAGNVEPFFRLGLALVNAGRWLEARSVFNAINNASPGYLDAGERADELRDWEQAVNRVLAQGDTGSELLKRYELMGEIGQGGMSVVYRARDRSLDREVAFKVLAESMTKNPQMAAMIQQEARAGAQLLHPNIVCIYDSGSVGERAFICMELVSGETVEEILIRDGLFAVIDALAVTEEILVALAYAHSKGIIHGDVKPSNVIRNERGECKLMDFGSVKSLPLGDRTTVATGTPLYMAPELFAGHDMDARSDVFALGATLYEMISGAPPFDTAARDTAPIPLCEINAKVPAQLDDLVLQCLEFDVDRRPQSAGHMLLPVRSLLNAACSYLQSSGHLTPGATLASRPGHPPGQEPMTKGSGNESD